MYNQPFFMPSSMMMPLSRGTAMGMTRGLGMTPLGMAGSTGRIGLMGRIGNGIASLKGVNWSGLINGTSKTLGVINQTIPIVKQVKPVMNNMRSMLKIASAFKDETDNSRKNRYRKNTSRDLTSRIENNSNKEINTKKVDNLIQEDYSPTFFVNA